MIRFLTAGESHGKGLLVILEGVPSDLPMTEEDLNQDLARRQKGYGRGGRMKIENDRVEIISGVRRGKTLGSPVGIMIRNRDWENWKELMKVENNISALSAANSLKVPRPGHADLAGGIKFGHRDLRNVLERASARETAARTAAGAVCRRLLAEFGAVIKSQVLEIGGVQVKGEGSKVKDNDYWEKVEKSELHCGDPGAEKRMKKLIDQAREKGDTVGGVFEIRAFGLPPGLGNYVQWDLRLDGRLAQALMSIPAIKGVEIGMGFLAARKLGSQVHDEISYRSKVKGQGSKVSFFRKTNHAGGLEGGVTNGEDLVIRAAMKPISTLLKPKNSVHIETKEAVPATVERSDICAVPAAAVVGEGMTALELARAFLEKFGGDSIREVRRNFLSYLREVEAY
ncbi:MAG: chorismate synthase [bacterium]|nr:chorismate synthase [bacterium]